MVVARTRYGSVEDTTCQLHLCPMKSTSIGTRSSPGSDAKSLLWKMVDMPTAVVDSVRWRMIQDRVVFGKESY